MNHGQRVRDAKRRGPQDATPTMGARRRLGYSNRTHWMAAGRRQRPALSGRLVMLDGCLVHAARSSEGITS